MTPSFSAENLLYLGIDMPSGVVSHPWTAAMLPSAAGAGAGARAAVHPTHCSHGACKPCGVSPFCLQKVRRPSASHLPNPPLQAAGDVGFPTPARAALPVSLILDVSRRPLRPRDESCDPTWGRTRGSACRTSCPSCSPRTGRHGAAGVASRHGAWHEGRAACTRRTRTFYHGRKPPAPASRRRHGLCAMK